MSDRNPFFFFLKKILVTGASSGIGKAIAIECARMSGEIVVSGRNVERLQETMALLEGGGHISMPADLTSEDELERLVLECPIVDGLVLCAGKSEMTPLLFCSRKKFDSLFNVNFFPQTLRHKCS